MHILVYFDCICGRNPALADRAVVGFAERAIGKLACIADDRRKTRRQKSCAFDYDLARLHGRVVTIHNDGVNAVVCTRIIANNDGRILIVEADALVWHDEVLIVGPKEVGEIRTSHVRFDARSQTELRKLLKCKVEKLRLC